MFIAKVLGSVVSTQKTEAMIGHRLLLIEPFILDPADPDGRRLVSNHKTLVAIDTVGAGENEFVLVVQGSSARMTPETKNLPSDCATVGIIDSIQIDHEALELH
ncbi:MAG: EutN/CcmL family microcompartment protein [Thermoguttaceae bacterium]|nr:EutN/CcmL family microcompartment protein [Thermoguttaceae bacterium]